MATRLKVYDPAKGREVTVGEIQKDVFIKRTGKAHYMIKHKGYGISKIVIDKLVKLKITGIIVKTITEEYHTSLENWVTNGIVDDYGHGEQIFLGVAKMSRR